jgi:GntR family transcriptional regulator / MocR family aminotransferase
MTELLVSLDTGSRQPLHRQVYEQIRGAILAGRLPRGGRLPSTRDLARQLAVARNTVSRAYDDLLSEGYLVGQVGSGTYVSRALPDQPLRSEMAGDAPPGRGPTELSIWAQRALAAEIAEEGPRLSFDFRPGMPDWQAFPHRLWGRLVSRALRRLHAGLARSGDPAGYPPLRQAISEHLAVSRAVRCDANRVVIVNGAQQAVDLIGRLFVNPGDVVAVEEPGYHHARHVLAGYGAHVRPVPVDEEGIDVQRLAESAEGQRVRLAYLTPSHQFPTGATLSLGRRLTLLDWARSTGALIVEDDYDSEFRYAGRPVESLQGLDRAGQVIYVGTFARALFPPLRIGYVVLPADLVQPFVETKWLADRQTGILEQLALADFLQEGHFERHLRRMRRLCGRRRDVLLAAVSRHLGTWGEATGVAAGLHVMLRLRGLADTPDLEDTIVEAAASRGVAVYPARQCYAADQTEPAVLLGFGAIQPEQIEPGIERLARALADIDGARATRSDLGRLKNGRLY